MLSSNNLGSPSNKHQSSESLTNSSKLRLLHSSTSTSFKITCNSSASSPPKLTSAFAWLGPDREPFDIWTQEPSSDEHTLRARAASICDCLDFKCVGCFYPCSVCKSTKCSGRIQEPTPFVFDLFWDHRLRDIFKYQTENRGSLQSCKQFRDWVVYKVQDFFSSRARWLDPKKDASYKATVETVCTLPSIKHRDPQPTASFFACDLPPLPPDAPDDLTDPRDLAIDRFLREKRGKRDEATPPASSSFFASSAKPSASSTSCARSSASNRGLSPPPAKLARIEICSSGDTKAPITSHSPSLDTSTVASSASALASATATAAAAASSTIANRSSDPIEIEDNDPIVIADDD